MKLVSNWRSALRMLSVQAATLGATVSGAYATFYPQLQEHIDPSLMGWITGSVFVLSIAARLIDQGLAAEEKAGE